MTKLGEGLIKGMKEALTDESRSKNVGFYEAGEYIVSAGYWKNILDADTFEIGIRHKETGKFWLLQSEKYDYQSVQEMANVIAIMLADKTQCYDPDWMQRMMT